MARQLARRRAHDGLALEAATADQRFGDIERGGTGAVGRPRVSREVRQLIAQMARQNFSGVRHGSMASF